MTNRSSGSCGGREFLRVPRDRAAQAYLQSRIPGFILCELVHKFRVRRLAISRPQTAKA
jgi:hypothetical protein